MRDKEPLILCDKMCEKNAEVSLKMLIETRENTVSVGWKCGFADSFFNVLEEISVQV